MAFHYTVLTLHYLPDILSAGFSTFPAMLAVAGLHWASPSASLDNKDLLDLIFVPFTIPQQTGVVKIFLRTGLPFWYNRQAFILFPGHAQNPLIYILPIDEGMLPQFTLCSKPERKCRLQA